MTTFKFTCFIETVTGGLRLKVFVFTQQVSSLAAFGVKNETSFTGQHRKLLANGQL